MKILLVEDDLEISKLLAEFLQENGYEVFCQYDGLHVLDCLREIKIDLILLDIMLPYRNGDTVLTAVRECSTVPIIVISAKGTTQNKVDLLRLGADDYITKPFSLAVLRARIEVQKRRIREQRENQSIKSILPNCYVIDDLKFDFERLCFFKGEEELSLSRNEQRLLQIFLKNQGRILTREILMERLWQDGAEFVDENALSVTINRLRKKIEGETKYIQTVYGQGYIWRKEE